MKSVVENRAVLDCIGFDVVGKGELAVRFAKASFRPDGTVETRGKPHRFLLLPGDDIDAMISNITPHLARMGYDPPSEADVIKLKGIATVVWTPETMAEHAQRWAGWEIANEEHCRAHGLPALTFEQGRAVDFALRLNAALTDWLAGDDSGELLSVIGGH